jgi:dipeptidyl aminopeptidase/acylaminoacyl peptidase
VRQIIFVIVAALALSLSAGARAAAPPPPLGVEAYGRLPNVELVRMSPSGEKIAYISASGDQRRVVVKDLAGKVLLTEDAGNLKVRELEWAGDGHLILTLSMTQSLISETGEYFHSLVVNVDTGKHFIVFYPSEEMFNAAFGYHGAIQESGRWYGLFSGITLHKTRGFEASLNNENFVDLYKVNLDNGEYVMVAPGRQFPHSWAVGADGKVIAHSEYDRRSGQWRLSAGAEGGATIATLSEPYGEAEILGPGRTPGTIVVDRTPPEEWSVADGSHTALSPGRAIDAFLFDPTTFRLVGLDLTGDQNGQIFFDPVLAGRLSAFRKALGPSVSISSWSADFHRMVLHTVGDGDAGTFWLVDGRAVKAFAYAYPEIPDANVGTVRAIVYKAGDGTEIHAILTLPPGREAKDLPVVVLPHGGPEGHDSVGADFDWWAQAFAGHGYAVLQPNFRGSNGYGAAFRNAGFGEWGRKMQTDVSDGLAALARQGVVDPKRACIVGGSYGGYAALAGVTVQQGLYRCAVSYGGVSDLSYLLDHDFPESSTDNGGGRYMLRFLGVTSTNAAALREISPVRLAAKADAPILLIHGDNDTVVPIGQSREMAAALKRAGKPVEVVELPGEDHWLSQDSTRKAMLAAALAFVERNDPPN